MNKLSDAMVIDAWSKNTDPWTVAVRSGDIESRKLVTNDAIVDAVRSRAPRSGIDIGCGEGWLVCALAGIEMIGVDVVPGLIDAAREAGGGDFRVLSYEQIAEGALQLAAPSQAGPACMRKTISACWKCASRSIPSPANRCRSS